MKRALLLLALFAPKTFAAADLVITQQGELSAAAAAREYAQLISADTAEAGSTNSVIVATGHAARVGDVIRFTDAGLNFMVEARVQSTGTNTITLYRSLPATPSAGANFSIYRLTTPTVTSSGAVNINGSISATNPSVSATGIAVPADATFVGGKGADGFLHGLSTDNTGALNVNAGGSSGGVSELLYQHDYSTPVTSAYTEITAATAGDINRFLIFDSSGVLLALATGGAGSEVDFAFIPPGGTSAGIPILVPSGTRLSFHAVGGVDATSGYIAITGIQ